MNGLVMYVTQVAVQLMQGTNKRTEQLFAF